MCLNLNKIWKSIKLRVIRKNSSNYFELFLYFSNVMVWFLASILKY